MEKAFYGPYFRTIMKIMHGKKIIGKASKDEIEQLAKIVTKSLSPIDNKRTEEEINRKLMQKLKIIYTEQLPRFSGTAGMASINRNDVY